MKILWITGLPSPYRVNFFNEIGKFCELTVVFDNDSAKYRDENWFDNNFINFSGMFFRKIGNKINIRRYLNILNNINVNSFDIYVISDYTIVSVIIMMILFKIKKISYFISADGGFIKNDFGIKKFIKTKLIGSGNWWLSSGSETTKYLNYYGAILNKIFEYPFSSIMCEDIIEKPTDIITKRKIKKMININEEKVILAIGQFINRKGFDVLINASTNINNNCGVYIVGGEPTKEYIDLKKKLELVNIHFVGFKSKEELKEYYIGSDIFVLPTREDIWGLVINEAMANGLPVITTDKCIAGLELVEDYENGFIVPIDDVKQLAEKINIILSNNGLHESMSNKSLEKIREYTIEKMAERHLEIFEKILIDKIV